LVKRDGFLDLDLEIAVAQENPPAMLSYEIMKGGVRAGVSVGVIVLKHYTSDEEQWERQVVVIDEVLPLEASICGIPSNQRSWVRDAIKSLVDRGVLVLSCDAQGCRPWLKSAAVEVPIMADTTDTDEIDDVDATPVEEPADGGDPASDATSPDEPAPGCPCGHHPEHMSEEDVELTAATRMLAAPVAADAVAPDEDGEEEDIVDEAVFTAGLSELLQKAGARHSDADQKMLQTCHDMTAKLGAKCTDSKAASTDILAASLAEEVAEMDAQQRLWRITYAFTDALMEILEDESDADARVSAVESLIVEYHDLVVQIVRDMPVVEPGEGDEETVAVWPAVAQAALDAYLTAKGIVDSTRAADDNVTEVTAKIAEFEATIVALTDERDALTQKAEELQAWQDNATAEIKRFLDMAMPLKTKPNSGDSVRDAAQGLAKRLPEFSPFVISRLEK
jgi:hypothetical protein